MDNKVKTFARDASFAVISQVVSLFSGFVLSFILPKYISVANYGYWQLFILYTGYIGFLHFGFNDGMYLKLGGKNFDSLDKGQIYPAMSILLLQQVTLAGILLCLSLFIENDPIKRLLFIMLSVYIVIDNVYKLMSFVLMATGKVNFYSRTVIYDKVILLVCVFALLCFKTNAHVGFFVGAYVMAHAIVFLLTSSQFPGYLYKGIKNLQKGAHIYLDCVKVGAVLMFSNLCSTFIVGSGRFIIEGCWNIEMFAKVSLALTLSAFLLFFISQISYVLFPYLRNMSEQSQAFVLEKGTFLLTVCAIVCFFLFFLLYYIVKLWLPQYEESLPFLIILSPLSFYDIKNNLLYNTFFKNLNKVKVLFTINVMTLIVANLIYLFGANIRNIYVIVGGMMFAIVFKSFIMQRILFGYYALKLDKSAYMELGMTVILLCTFFAFGIRCVFVCYIVLALMFMFLNRKSLEATFAWIKKIRR